MFTGILSHDSRISIHALLAESDVEVQQFRVGGRHISIHALLAESDGTVGAGYHVAQDISIHALLAESDFFQNHIFFNHSLFLSTLSLRRATSALAPKQNATEHFYPRSPCGERP